MMWNQQSSQTSDNTINSEEDIIRCFENDTFLRKFKTNANSSFSIKSEMDNLFMWLNRDFVPNFFLQLSAFTKEETKDCLIKSRRIHTMFSTIIKHITKQTSKPGFIYYCSKCDAEIKNKPNRSVSAALQQHEHVEEILAGHSFINKAPVSVVSQPTTKNWCSKCCSSIDVPTNFKFSFNISYHPDVEKLLYMHNFKNDVIQINNLNLFTVQLKHKEQCICLLCLRDFGLPLTKGHINGKQHLKNKMNDTSISILLAYHTNWLKLEKSFQAHQIYFNPFSVNANICCLCNNMHVPYQFLEDHLMDSTHKLQIFKKEEKNLLLDLQKDIYQSKELENELSSSNDADPDVTMDEPEPSTSSNNAQELSESDNSDDESFVDESDDVSKNQQENVSTNKMDQVHEIIKSIAVDATDELSTFLEHRFWPHFDKIMFVCGEKVECQFCDKIIDKSHDAITQHILSDKHQKCREVPKISYGFHCEICNLSMKYNHNWFLHLKSERHQNRCQSLGKSRLNNLKEYECKSCKLIFFGDEISIKRHIIMGKKGKKRKSKNVVLDKRINEMFNSEDNIINEAKRLVKEAEEVLLNRENVIECCNAIKEALMETYSNCNVHPFGSQVSGLGSKKSDLDLFVDLGDMYLGDKGQDSTSQVKIVANVMKIFSKKKGEFKYLNPIPKARTPIVQLYHVKTRLDCDLSFRHGLSVENTKFLRLCIEVQPCTQYLILLLKQWLDYTKLAHRHITTYSLAMMVIFYLQVHKYLLPVHLLRQLSSDPQIVIDGWCIMDLSSISIDELKKLVTPCNKSIKEMLTQFFLFYKNFNYAVDIVCPLLGRPIKKILFTSNFQGFNLPLEMSIYVHKVAQHTTELFRAESPMCIQDPFDLSHNLTKSCSNSVVERFKKLCELSYKLLAP